MNKDKCGFPNVLKECWIGLFATIAIGTAAVYLKNTIHWPIVDPLLVSLAIGIVIRTGVQNSRSLKLGTDVSQKIFIPIGIIFYGMNNLNFLKTAKVEASIFILLGCVILVYFTVILSLGRWLKQKKEITYLTATGSAICGASAIVITSPAVEAEPDDISISLLSVALAGLVGLFIIHPFMATFLGITNKTYALLSGSTLPLTGFVKAAIGNVPYLSKEIPAKELMSLAISIKAIKYLALLATIPLLASLTKNKFYIPWFLWAFLAAGLIGTWVYASNEEIYKNTLIPMINPIYKICWSTAMAAVGLNTDLRKLLSNNGTKALIMAFSGFIAATVTFFVGINILSL